MNLSPLVSVIIPFYNEEKSISDAVESILNQTYQHFEIVLVDDHSTDRSVEIIRNFRDPRVRLIQKDASIPQGRASSRNLAIQESQGKLVMLQDADDLSMPTRLARQVERYLANQEKNPIVGCAIKINAPGQQRVKLLPEDHAQIIQGFQRKWNRVTIVAGTLLLAKETLLQYPYRTRYQHMEDWDLLLRLYESKRFFFTNVNQPLYQYNLPDGGSKSEEDWILYN
ncbi:glycosyltransferase family 2 protein, partial [Candidatus Woesearchaeota archaeon]